jgi:hypothetical protein
MTCLWTRATRFSAQLRSCFLCGLACVPVIAPAPGLLAGLVAVLVGGVAGWALRSLNAHTSQRKTDTSSTAIVSCFAMDQAEFFVPFFVLIRLSHDLRRDLPLLTRKPWTCFQRSVRWSEGGHPDGDRQLTGNDCLLRLGDLCRAGASRKFGTRGSKNTINERCYCVYAGFVGKNGYVSPPGIIFAPGLLQAAAAMIWPHRGR